MQHFQPILIAIGILAIAGVLIHGFLLNRKNEQTQPSEQQAEHDPLETEQQQYQQQANVEHDIDNVSFSSEQAPLTSEQQEPRLNLDDLDAAVESTEQADVPAQEPLQSEQNSGQPESHDSENSEEVGLSAANPAQTEAAAKVEREPEPQDLFIFNVVAKDEMMLGGHKLLQFFLTSGFRFGEMNIFHRHENSDGTGEIQFSIANMMAPGTFELDEMEQFRTKGISFFLTAPNPKISVKQSFDLMLRAVVQLADEFDCDVLNAQREPLTEEQFLEYRSRLQQYP